MESGLEHKCEGVIERECGTGMEVLIGTQATYQASVIKAQTSAPGHMPHYVLLRMNVSTIYASTD